MINAYNPDILKIWRANTDIQLIQGVYGVAMYICTYICKSEPQGLKLPLRNKFPVVWEFLGIPRNS